MNKFIVELSGQLACRGSVTAGAFRWRPIAPNVAPPDDILTWDTQEGAQKFTGMNGGAITTVLDYFYSPRPVGN